MPSDSRISAAGPPFPLLLAAISVVMTAPLLVVLEKIGVPALLLLGITAGLAVFLVVAAAASGGTMRLPTYLTAGRGLGGAAAGLAFAACLPAPPAAGAVIWQAVALALAVLLLAPAIRRSGAVSLPGFLAVRYGSHALRILSALVITLAGLALGAAGMASAARSLQVALPLGSTGSIALCASAAFVVLLPGGGAGLTRAAVVAGFLLLVAAGAVVALAAWTGGPSAGAAAIGPALLQKPAPLPVIGAVLAVLAAPQLAWIAVATRDVQDLRPAAGWALVATVLIGIGLAVQPQPGGSTALVFAGIAGAAPQVLGVLVAAIALLGSAGLALGYDLPGRRAAWKAPTSRRFAQLRAAMAVTVGVATALVALRRPELSAWAEIGGALLVATVLPPLALTLLRPSAGAGAGFGAMAAGIAAGALALDPRIWPAGTPVLSPAIAGFVAGLVVGLLLSLVVPSARPAEQSGDGAL